MQNCSNRYDVAEPTPQTVTGRMTVAGSRRLREESGGQHGDEPCKCCGVGVLWWGRVPDDECGSHLVSRFGEIAEAFDGQAMFGSAGDDLALVEVAEVDKRVEPGRDAADLDGWRVLRQDGNQPVTAASVCQSGTAHVTVELPAEIAALLSLILAINAWNIIGVATRAWEPGSYAP